MKHSTTARVAIIFFAFLMSSDLVAQGVTKSVLQVEGILDCAGLHTEQSSSELMEKPDCSKKTQVADGTLVEASLGDTIAVEVGGLKDWIEKDPSKPDPYKLIPYLDGWPLTGNYPSAVESAQNKLVYQLQISPKSKNSWVEQLSQHKKHKVKLSIGLEEKSPFPSEVFFKLRIFSKWVWPFLVVLIFALLVFFFFASRSAMLREPGVPPPKGRPKAFSLARSQMAFWFFLILACYVFMLVNTWDKDILPESVLVLMGISAGTYLGAVVVDSSKRTDAENELPQLRAEQATLRAVAAPSPDQTARLKAVGEKIARYSSAIYPDESHGLWADVLSDANGISLHRFQMVVWTGVLGILFLKFSLEFAHNARIQYDIARPNGD